MANHTSDFMDLEYWARAGQGRSLQFFATDEEVARWLTVALPDKYEPYELLGADRIKEGKNWILYPFTCKPTNFLECITKSSIPRNQFWIRSKVLTPDIKLEPFTKHPFMGLILIQHGSFIRVRNPRDPMLAKYKDASAIGVVDRIVHLKTGEIREFPEYRKIYFSLRRVIKKELVYSSLVRFADGHEEEDTRVALMTRGAVQAYEQGVPFLHRPGKLLK